MTFRRVMLVVLPVLGAIFVFMLIKWAYRDWETSLVPPHNAASDKPDMVSGKDEMKLQKDMEHVVSENLDLMRRDKEQRLEMRFMAARVEHSSGKSWDVTKPRIQFFTRAGEIINLEADQGRVISGGNLTSLDQIESGVLWGHVVMDHDRGTPDDQTDDILVTLDEITFSNDTFELATGGPVVMVSNDMQMTARKMRITLDRTTRRMNTLTFLEDIRLSMDVGDKSKLLAPPTEAPAPPAKAVTPTAPGKAGAPQDDRAELWRIDLVGNVDARQTGQKITCQHLSMFNRSSRGADSSKTPGAASKDKTPTAPPKKAGDQPARGQLVVIADGPLMITPVSAAERVAMGDKQYQVMATGAPVVVDDGQTKIVGAEVQYNTKSGSGTVIGKDAPILLEQPGRLRLTGLRLDFDRLIRPGHELPTADVQGEGTLNAQVQTAEVVPTARPKSAAATASAATATAATAAPPQTSELDAVWTRGMHMEFYQVPATLSTNTGATTGEVRTAIFHGQAVLKQRDGILKGDELALNFFRPEAGKGQAIERLQGQGNVYIKNQPPVGQAAKPTTSASVGDISCQKIDMTFKRDVTGEAQPLHLAASGGVVMHEAPTGTAATAPAPDPQKPSIRAEQLVIDFGPAAKGGVEPQFFEATGNALVNRADLYAEGDHIRRDLASGTLLLEGKPAKASRGTTRIQGPRIDFNQADGIATVRGAGELEMLSATDLRGTRRKAPEPLLVRWKNSMLYEDQRNFAQFDGNAMAATSTSRLDSDKLWVYFADRPKPPAGAAAPTATAAAGSPALAAAKAPVAKAPKANPGDDMGQLFGNKDSAKDIVRIFAENNVRAIDRQLEPDGMLRYQMEIGGDNLTYVAETRNVYVRSPGRVRILSHEKSAAGQVVGPGITPEAAAGAVKGPVPAGYSRTEVAWIDTMAYDAATEQAYFKGNVDATYAGRKAPTAGAAGQGRVSDMRVQSNELQVVFIPKAPAVTATAGAASGTATPPPPPATLPPPAAVSATTPTAEAAQTPQDRMNVDKFVANGNVRLAIDNRRGTSERLIYQRDPEIVRLYRGAEDWARLWEEDEAKQQYGEVVARTISYEPTSGHIEMQEQQMMTVAPKTLPPKKTAAKP